MTMLIRVLLFASLLAAAACGGGEGDPDAVICETSGRYLELTTGATWAYRVTDASNVRTDKTQTVGPFEDVGGDKAGTMAFRLTTTKGALGNGLTISWQEDTGSGVIRHREQDMSGSTQSDEIYAPFRTRIDETPAHTATGAAWQENYTETVTVTGLPPMMIAKVEDWSVIAVDEVVSVPAGTFCALHVHRESMAGGIDGSVKDYWFARGVGKVKETGVNQTEELASYSR
jgi:hypothetical protein